MSSDRKVYKLEDVAAHNKLEDCWLVMFGKVYNVTEFMDDHPGGGDVLVSSTGKDATEDFEDVGHSKAAREQLDKYYIGEIDETTLPNSKKSYIAPQTKQAGHGQGGNSGGEFITKFLQFLAPLIVLAVALAVRHYTRKHDASHSE